MFYKTSGVIHVENTGWLLWDLVYLMSKFGHWLHDPVTNYLALHSYTTPARNWFIQTSNRIDKNA